MNNLSILGGGSSLLNNSVSNYSTKSTGARFDQFLENIKLTSIQNDDAKTKYDGVCKKLHDYFYSNSQYSGATKLLVGSYGKNTNIRPARDVDVFFKIPHTEFKPTSPAYNVQSALLQRVKNIIKEKYSDTDVKADRNVVVVKFSNSHFIELVPCFEFTMEGSEKGKFYIPDSSNGGSWKLVNPRAEIKQINDSDAATMGNAKNLIRMVKKWQHNCNVPIKSMVLELRAVNFLKNYQYALKPSFYYDWMIRDFFEELIKFVNATCKLPDSEEIIFYGDSWKSKAESAYDRAVKACGYEIEKKYDFATLEWKKIFGDDYYF